MADIHQTISLGPADGSRFQRVIAEVRPGSHFSIVPSPLLEMLGVEPKWTEMVTSPGGGQERFFATEVRIRMDDRERTTICLFGGADSQPILGKYTLDAFGLAVDGAGDKLVATPPSVE